MTLIALLMRPWILHMRDNQLTPRVLADDLYISASRDNHANNTTKGMQLSRTYFHDIGAKVADNKCFLASTCPTTRQQLRKLTWDTKGTKLKVVTHFRDLGAHVAMDSRNAASTTTRRIQKATAKVKRLKWLPISPAGKSTTITTTVLPAALYGTEVGNGSKRATQALRTAIGDTMGPSSARRCLAMVFTYNNKKTDLDPQVQQLVRKVLLLRRIIAKYPKHLTTAKAAICAYTQQGKAGSTTTLTYDQPNQPHMGPIGHILSSLH